jgi:predicted dienelactone hydrolase
MIGAEGLDALAEAVASDGFLVVFEAPAGSEFALIDPPNPST